MKPMCKAELRQFIDQVSFMIDDITLFLDTHPDCREAIDAYNHFKMMRCEAVSDYVKQECMDRWSMALGRSVWLLNVDL